MVKKKNKLKLYTVEYEFTDGDSIEVKAMNKKDAERKAKKLIREYEIEITEVYESSEVPF